MVDHITPKFRGGRDDDANLRGCCKRCHETKSAREGAQVRNAQQLGRTT
jgi:5-methylcytosine-specific restriction endonuclease McrA